MPHSSVAAVPAARSRRAIVWMILSGGLWTTALVLLGRQVQEVGRGGHVLMFDDVVYATVGKRIGIQTGLSESLTALWEWLIGGPHAPATEALAIVAWELLPRDSRGIYVVSTLVAGILSIALATLIARAWWARLAIAAVLLATPQFFLVANEFRPDLLFTIVAATVLIGVIPYRLHSEQPVRSKPVLLAAAAVSLVFIKPSWAALAAVVWLAGLLAWFVGNVFLPRGSRGSSRGERAAAAAVFVVGLAVWAVWLRQHFIDYVLENALKSEYRLAATRMDAVTTSLDQAGAYLGNGLQLTWMLLLISVAAWVRAFFTHPDRSRPAAILVTVLSGLGAPAVVLLATWLSRHPSPFQGLLFFGLLSGLALGLLVASGRLLLQGRRVSAGWPTAVVLLLATGLVTGLFLRTESRLSYPEDTLLDRSPILAVADGLARACLARADCREQPARFRVGVTMSEDGNSSAFSYYLPPEASDLVMVDTPDAEVNTPVVLAALEAVRFAVVRRSNYEANGIPRNMIQRELYDALRSSDRWAPVPITGSGDYAVFERAN